MRRLIQQTTYLWSSAMIMRLLCEPSHVALEETGCCVHCQFSPSELPLRRYLATRRVGEAEDISCTLQRSGGKECTLNMREPYPNTTYGVFIPIRPKLTVNLKVPAYKSDSECIQIQERTRITCSNHHPTRDLTHIFFCTASTVLLQKIDTPFSWYYICMA